MNQHSETALRFHTETTEISPAQRLAAGMQDSTQMNADKQG